MEIETDNGPPLLEQSTAATTSHGLRSARHLPHTSGCVNLGAGNAWVCQEKASNRKKVEQVVRELATPVQDEAAPLEAMEWLSPKRLNSRRGVLAH